MKARSRSRIGVVPGLTSSEDRHHFNLEGARNKNADTKNARRRPQADQRSDFDHTGL